MILAHLMAAPLTGMVMKIIVLSLMVRAWRSSRTTPHMESGLSRLFKTDARHWDLLVLQTSSSRLAPKSCKWEKQAINFSTILVSLFLYIISKTHHVINYLPKNI